MIIFFLDNLTYLEPLNLFLYTWRFLSELESEANNPKLKKFYKYFAQVSIVIIPVAFITIVPAFIVIEAKYVTNYYK